MSGFQKVENSSVNKKLRYRNVPDPNTFLSSKKKFKTGITSFEIDGKMEQREYEINNKEIIEHVSFMVQLSEKEQKEKGIYLSGNYPESEIFKIMAAHDFSDKKWTEAFRGGTSRYPYLFDPAPIGLSSIHIRLLQISQDVVFDSIGIKFYIKNIVKKNPDEFNMLNLSFEDKNKIINAFWFIYFGLDKYPDFIQDISEVQDDFLTYKANKHFYYFNKSHDGKYISWDTYNLKMYDVDDKPDSFNNNHKLMLIKFMKNFIYPTKIEYKDVNNKTSLSMNTIINHLKKQCTEIKNNESRFNNFNEVSKKFYNNFEEINDDYISILSMDKDLLITFVRKWTCFFWNPCPERENDKIDIIEEFMYIPHIVDNKINWLRIQVKQSLNKKEIKKE